jgi:hypothetical protein
MEDLVFQIEKAMGRDEKEGFMVHSSLLNAAKCTCFMNSLTFNSYVDERRLMASQCWLSRTFSELSNSINNVGLPWQSGNSCVLTS